VHYRQVEVGKRSEGAERIQSLLTKMRSTQVEVSKSAEGRQCSCALVAHGDVGWTPVDVFVTQIEVSESSEARQRGCRRIAESR